MTYKLPFVCLLTEAYIDLHENFINSVKIKQPEFSEVKHYILYSESIDFRKILTYLPTAIFKKVPTDFLSFRKKEFPVYPNFVRTYDKLFAFWVQELSNGFILYDADMIMLNRIEIEKYYDSKVIWGATDRVSAINTGFVIFPKFVLKNIETIKVLIQEYATDDLEFPDQQVINRIFNSANFDSDIVYCETIELSAPERILKCGIFHYIGKNKDIKKYLAHTLTTHRYCLHSFIPETITNSYLRSFLFLTILHLF